MVWQPLKFSQFRFFFGHEIFEMQFSSMKFWTWTLGSRSNRRFAFDIAAFAEFWIIHRKYNRYENDIKSENGTDSRLISHFRLKITISGFKNELIVGNSDFWTKTLKWTMIGYESYRMIPWGHKFPGIVPNYKIRLFLRFASAFFTI